LRGGQLKGRGAFRSRKGKRRGTIMNFTSWQKKGGRKKSERQRAHNHACEKRSEKGGGKECVGQKGPRGNLK